MPVTIEFLDLPVFLNAYPRTQARAVVFAVLAPQTPFDSAEDIQIPLSAFAPETSRSESGGTCSIGKITAGRCRGTRAPPVNVRPGPAVP